MQIKNYRDFWAGILFMAFGLAFVLYARDYSMGTAAKMGPAYFPTMLGGLLFVLGGVITLLGLGRSDKPVTVDPTGWREIGLILLAVIAFGISLPTMGIIVAIALLIWIASPASHEFKVRDTLIATIVLMALSYFVFVKGLELQFPFLPKFLDR